MSASGLKLRDYQAECIDIIDNLDGGAHLVQMATGLGKTVTFANIHRHGRMLILSHRDELVAQPVKYFDCPVGIEKAERHSDGEPVVSGSVQTLSRGTRLERNFKPGDFDLIVTDEAHHASAPTYRKIIDYLQPRLHIGFTATRTEATVGDWTISSRILSSSATSSGVSAAGTSAISTACRSRSNGPPLA